MPDAHAIARLRGGRPYRSLTQALALIVAVVPAAAAQERYINFDMDSQPLGSALVEFANRTGMTALVDGELASGLRSSPVRGRLSLASVAGRTAWCCLWPRCDN